jgi:hypothetical protein
MGSWPRRRTARMGLGRRRRARVPYSAGEDDAVTSLQALRWQHVRLFETGKWFEVSLMHDYSRTRDENEKGLVL